MATYWYIGRFEPDSHRIRYADKIRVDTRLARLLMIHAKAESVTIKGVFGTENPVGEIFSHMKASRRYNSIVFLLYNRKYLKWLAKSEYSGLSNTIQNTIITQITNTKGSHPILPFIWESREGARKTTLLTFAFSQEELIYLSLSPLKIQIHQCSRKEFDQGALGDRSSETWRSNQSATLAPC